MASTAEVNDLAARYSLIDLVRVLLRFIRPYRRRFWLASTSRLISDLAWLYPAYGFAALITFLSTYKTGDPLRVAWVLSGLWLLAVIFRYGGNFIAKFFCYRVAERVELDGQLAGIQKLFLLDMAWHERENAGNKLKRIQKGGEGMQQVIRIWIDNLIEIGVNFFGMTIIIASIDPKMSFMLLLFIFTYFPISYVMVRGAARAARAVNSKEEEVNGLLFESLNNIRSAKVMGMIPELGRRIAAMAQDLFNLIVERVFRFQVRASSLGGYANIFKLGCLAFIVYGIARGHYEVGFIILFNGYFNDLRVSMEELASVSEKITVAKYAVARMMSIVDEPINIDEEEGKVPFPADWKEIKLDKVSFGYGSEDVLKNISLEIRRGEKLGIVGLSGAGKSTLFKLLLKEREEYEGEITYDGLPLRNISKIGYFQHVAVVLQDTEVFNFSLRDNITIANIELQNDKRLLDRALDVAHVAEFVHKLPKGLDTLIGEKGVKLSGGEKQRLGIARAIFKSPQILFMDEATSHLDLESEEKIRDSLKHFFKDVTAVVIAHRLTTIREMDRILVLENGRIVEQGSWSSLMRKRGRFRELWDKQRL